MYITKVVSFEGSWLKLTLKYQSQFSNIKDAIGQLTSDNITNAAPKYISGPGDEGNGPSPRKLLSCWDQVIEDQKWLEVRRLKGIGKDNRKYYWLLGHSFGVVSVKLIRHRDTMNRWLFSSTPIAYRNSVIEMPVAILLLENDEKDLFENLTPMRASFESCLSELEALSPLSQTHPFVILGISQNDEQIEVIDIESDLGIAEKKIVINRFIEFPPEFHQAGLGILNYFGTVLREKYPDEKAKVKIEQDGHKVRMIIETEDGNKETIEKALHDYELVIRGEQPPESLYDNKLQVLELKTELRMAYMRIESQRDLLEHKNQELGDLKNLFGHALTHGNSNPLSLTVSPVINVTTSQSNSVVINNDLLDVVDDIQSLLSKCGDDTSTELRLLDLSESLQNISEGQNPHQVKNATGMKKLKKFLEDAQQAGSSANKFVSSFAEGIDKLKYLGAKYNAIAEWCGAPQIPRILL